MSDSEDLDLEPCRREKFIWDSKLTTKLICLRGELRDMFPCLKGQAAAKWGKIADLLGLGQAQYKIVQKKFENLTNAYKDIIKKKPGEHRGKKTRKTWCHFEAMDAIIGQNSTNQVALFQHLRSAIDDSDVNISQPDTSDQQPVMKISDIVKGDRRSRCAKYRWSHSMTMELIRLRGKYHEMFPCYKGEAAEKWGKIAQKLGLGSENYNAVAKKFENLSNFYKELLRKSPREKVGLKTRITWPYFEAMDAVCGKEYILGPASSLDFSSQSAPDSSCESQTNLNSTPSPMSTTSEPINTCSNTTHTKSTPNSSTKSTPGPLKDSDETLPPGNRVEKYFWSVGLTKKLIRLRTEHKHIFPCYKGQAIEKWGLISELLGLDRAEHGIVARKFENLSRQYRVLLNPHLHHGEMKSRLTRESWPHFKAMHSLLQEVDETTQNSLDCSGESEMSDENSWQEMEMSSLGEAAQEMETKGHVSFKVEPEDFIEDLIALEPIERVDVQELTERVSSPVATERVPEQAERVQLDSLCRMCAKSSVANSTVLLSSNTTLLYQLLHYFGINVVETDGMPTSICDCCKNELDRIEQLKLTVARAQHYLKQKIEMNQQNTNKNHDNVVVEINKQDSDLEIFDENSDLENSNLFSKSDNLDMTNEDMDHLLATQCTVLVNSDTRSDESDVEMVENNSEISDEETSVNVKSYINKSNQKITIPPPKRTAEKLRLLKSASKKSVLKVNKMKKNNTAINKKYICRICNATYTSIKNWIMHFQTCHKDVEVCENTKNVKMEYGSNDVNKPKIIENEIFNEQDVIKKIKPNRQRKKKARKFTKVEEISHYSCDICNCKHFSPEQLYNHFLVKHVIENQLNCEFCTKCFEKPHDLLEHLKKHANNRKYFCPVCDRSCRSKYAVDIHIDCHSIDRNHQCSKCGKTYRTYSTLWSHIKYAHDNVKNFMCEHCSQMFRNKTNIRYHILRAHSEQKPYVCNICSKGFLTQFRLKQHNYVHSEFRPYHCIKCNRGYITLGQFRKHMRKRCNVPENEIVYFLPTLQRH